MSIFLSRLGPLAGFRSVVIVSAWGLSASGFVACSESPAANPGPVATGGAAGTGVTSMSGAGGGATAGATAATGGAAPSGGGMPPVAGSTMGGAGSGGGGAAGAAGTAGAAGVAGAAGTAAAGADMGGTSGAGGVNMGGAGGGSAAGGMPAAGGSAAGGAAGMQTMGGAGAGGASAGGSGGAGGATMCDTSPGNAMQFAEGVVDLMTGDIGADGPSGDGPRTLELWAKFISANSWTAEQTIIELGKRVNNMGDMVWGIDMSGYESNGGRFGPYTNGVTDNNGQSGPFYQAAADVGWLHLSWAYEGNGGEMVFTVNGEKLEIQDPGNNYTLGLTQGIVTLGGSQNFGADGWDGVMDEVRIWTIYRSPQEVADTMNVFLRGDEEGLAAYYNFDDSDGSFVDDVNGTPSHRLEPCTMPADRCPQNVVNNAMPTVVASDIPGPFTCAE